MELGIGLVGAGAIAKAHARALRSVAGARLAAVCSRTEAGARAFASEFGGAPVASTFEALLRLPDVTAVVLAVPNALHAPYALAALAAGKHVLVEKPMATTLADAKQMAAAAQKAGRCLMVGHMWRFDREAQYVRAQVAAGALGGVFKTKGYGVHVGWGPSGWFTSKAQAGGGALIDMGVHAIDTARFLLGDPRAVRVYADLGTRFGQYDVDDIGMVMIHWDSGAVSLIESGWWNPHADGPEASTQLFGTKGYGRLFPTEIAGERPSFPARAEHCDPHLYEGQLAAFAAAIRDGQSPPTFADAGIEAVRICEAAYASAAQRQAVVL